MITPKDLAWAAGFLDGEGSFCHNISKRQPQVMASQKDTWALNRLERLFGGSVYGGYLAKHNPKHQPIYRWALGGRAAAGLMMTLYCLLSPYRQRQIQKTLAIWKEIPANQQSYVRHGNLVWRRPCLA